MTTARWGWAANVKWDDKCHKCRCALRMENGNVVAFNKQFWCVPCLLDAGTEALDAKPEPTPLVLNPFGMFP